MRKLMYAVIGLGVFLPATIGSAEPTRKEKEKPTIEARLIVSDPAGLFSSEAVKKAKSSMSEIKDRHAREMSILTFKELPEDKKKAFARLEKDDKVARNKFFRDWAVEEAKNERATGVFVLVCRSPGQIEILADKLIRDKGFTARDEEQVRDLLMKRFLEAKEAKDKDKSEEEQTAIRDKGLSAAVDFVKDAYKKMVR